MRLRYWLREGLNLAITNVLAALIYTVFMGIPDSDFTLESFQEMSYIYLWTFGIILSMILTFNIHKLHLPLSLSFGSTRKECLVGMACYRLLHLLCTIAVTLLLALWGGEDLAFLIRASLVLFISAYLILSAIGTCISIAYLKFGKKALFLLAAVLVIFSAGIAVVIISAVHQARWLEVLLTGGTGTWLALAMGIAVCALSWILEVKTVRSFTVKL